MKRQDQTLVNKKKLNRIYRLLAVWLLLAVLALGGATYAWFTFNPQTNVEPMSSTISAGETCLLIATTADGEFDIECKLEPSANEALEPVSTVNLEHFYQSSMQNRDGITTKCKDTTDSILDKVIYGKIYLKSLKDDCNVYLYRPGMSIDSDPQTMAAMRLAFRCKTQQGTTVHIFKLDDFTNVSGAEVHKTVAENNAVVGSIDQNGSINYVNDPGEALREYYAVTENDHDIYPKAGQKALCTIGSDEIVEVEYWLYLEGCDENCYNPVQDKEVGLQLSFAGVTGEE